MPAPLWYYPDPLRADHCPGTAQAAHLAGFHDWTSPRIPRHSSRAIYPQSILRTGISPAQEILPRFCRERSDLGRSLRLIEPHGDLRLLRMACQTCRARHYRCDNKLPTCGRCQQEGQDCNRVTRDVIRHRASRTQFRAGQTWLPVPPKVDFVDETREIEGEYSKANPKPNGSRASLSTEDERLPPDRNESRRETRPEAVNTNDPLPVQSGDSGSPITVAWTPPTNSVNTAESVGSTAQSVLSPSVVLSQHSPQAVRLYGEFTAPQLSPSLQHRSDNSFSPTTVTHTPSSSISPWPVQTSQEALLLRHFIDNVSLFFDFCDPARHFALEVPQRARTNRTLANAILALSARHLSRTTPFDTFVADQYYQECLQTLIPALSEASAIMDNALLAALVVLRLLEEMDVPLVGSDLQGHLIGTQAIIRAQEVNADRAHSSLRQAACWAAFRQEVYICLTCERPVQLDIERAPVDWASRTVDDWTWSSYSVIHCRDVLEFAFGDEVKSTIAHHRLLEDNLKWRTQKESSFDPFYVNEHGAGQRNNIFPDVRLHDSCHVMGYQYNILAHMLLVIYDSNIPRAGPAHKEAVRRVDEQAREDVRMICGISLSNEHTPPAMLIAAMAVSLCGDRFTIYEEQKELKGILLRTEQLHGWPTATAQQQLSLAWGWSQTS